MTKTINEILDEARRLLEEWDGKRLSHHDLCTWTGNNLGAILDALNIARGALKGLLEEYDDRRGQFGDDYLWEKHEDTEVIEAAREALTTLSSDTLKAKD